MSNSQYPVVSPIMSTAKSTTVELLIVPVFGSTDLEEEVIKSLDSSSDGVVGRAWHSGEFQSKRHQILQVELKGEVWGARRAVLIGTEEREGSNSDRMRIAGAVGARLARKLCIGSIGILCRGEAAKGELVKAAIQGVGSGGFADSRYRKSKKNEKQSMSCELVWFEQCDEDLSDSIRHGNAIAQSVNVAREFANDPANILTPTAFAQRAVTVCEQSGLRTEVLDGTAILNLNMGLLLGVARGSEESPRLLVMRYEPDQSSEQTLGLVGKGVTFDSGGISIKPAGGMERMKSDMAGGAAVIGAMCAIAEIGAPISVVGLVPMTENMPSGLATKPGDILTAADGTTVEVINTDAEGRLILADALWYARKLGASHLVDIATLTGACVVALGKVASGVFGEPQEWVQSVTGAAERTGERLWNLPLYPEYREQLESELADLKNVGGREGGASTAAAFLQTFAGGKPWVHLDIAGTAWTETTTAVGEAGATGVMVRTMVELAVSDQDW
jgi:leucyl aminopeptidase